jgi:hypothetical protein
MGLFCVPQTVVFAMGPGTCIAHAERLGLALEDICSRQRGAAPGEGAGAPVTHAAVGSGEAATAKLPEMRLTPREAFFASSER